MNLLQDKLARWYEHGETVPGTPGYFQFCPVSLDKISYKWVSDDNDLAGTLSKAVNPKVSFDKISANECVAMTVTGVLEWCRM